MAFLGRLLVCWIDLLLHLCPLNVDGAVFAFRQGDSSAPFG